MDKPSTEFRNVFLIYCLQRLDDGTYAVLNRQYKPLGAFGNEWVDYMQAPGRLRFKRALTAAQAQALSARDNADASLIHLYHDGCIPTDSAASWAAYSARLQRLAGYLVTAPD